MENCCTEVIWYSLLYSDVWQFVALLTNIVTTLLDFFQQICERRPQGQCALLSTFGTLAYFSNWRRERNKFFLAFKFIESSSEKCIFSSFHLKTLHVFVSQSPTYFSFISFMFHAAFRLGTKEIESTWPRVCRHAATESCRTKRTLLFISYFQICNESLPSAIKQTFTNKKSFILEYCQCFIKILNKRDSNWFVASWCNLSRWRWEVSS